MSYRIPRLRPLAVAVAGLLVFASAAPAFAQAQDTGSSSMREQRAKRRAELGKDKQAAAAPRPALYPNATRTSPEAKAGAKMIKQLQAMQEAYEKQDMAGALAKAEAIANAASANAYEKSYAYSLAGNAAADMGDEAKAQGYFAKAVEANGLDNDGHYQVMYNLAVMQYGSEKYPEALATLDRFLAETKSEKPEHFAFRGGILAAMERYDDAAKVYMDLAAKHPTEKKYLMNAVASLQNADKFAESNKLLEDAYKRGMLTEQKELRALYVGYLNDERAKEALAVIDDGLAKGILKPGPELGKDLMVVAQTFYANDDDKTAATLYGRAGEMAADGEAYLNQAKLLSGLGKTAEAKAAAQRALDKGVKKPEEARKLIK